MKSADRKGAQFLKQFEPAPETSENDTKEDEEDSGDDEDDTEDENDPDEIPSFDDDETEEADWVAWCQDFLFRGTRTAQGVGTGFRVPL